MRFSLPLAFALAVSWACDAPHADPEGGASKPASEPPSGVVLVSDADWQQLNPKRGDQSPKAATLWGDRAGPGPSGFLLKPVDGFSSPPHVHTAPYLGVVISGAIHNAEPSAEVLFLPPGSFWTQPEGAVHITACSRDCLAYIEFEGGYDVLPVEGATGDPATAVALQPASIPWEDRTGPPASANGPQVAELWGDPQAGQPSGSLVRIPAGKTGTIRTDTWMFHAVAIDGRAKYREEGKNQAAPLDPGAYFLARAGSDHQISCGEEADCTLYVRSRGRIQVSPEGPVEP